MLGKVSLCSGGILSEYFGFPCQFPFLQLFLLSYTLYSLDLIVPLNNQLNMYIVQCWWFLISSEHQMYRVTPLKTPFGLVIPLLQSQSHVTTITHNYLLRCYAFTQLESLHVRKYNHSFHSCTFTQFTNTTL
jgi:hypothetical protein